MYFINNKLKCLNNSDVKNVEYFKYNIHENLRLTHKTELYFCGKGN